MRNTFLPYRLYIRNNIVKRHYNTGQLNLHKLGLPVIFYYLIFLSKYFQQVHFVIFMGI